MANNSDGKMAGNKGEWSELYAFLRLLSQGRVYAANEKVEKIDNVYYPILKIIREEQKGEVYDYCIENDAVVIETQSRRIMTIDRESLKEEADKLLEEIAVHSGSFEVEEVASFVNGIKVTKLKAPSTDTTDITMQIQDVYTNLVRKVGFSIKSEVGNAPTLLNAGKTTNFKYIDKNVRYGDTTSENKEQTVCNYIYNTRCKIAHYKYGQEEILDSDTLQESIIILSKLVKSVFEKLDDVLMEINTEIGIFREIEFMKEME